MFAARPPGVLLIALAMMIGGLLAYERSTGQVTRWLRPPERILDLTEPDLSSIATGGRLVTTQVVGQGALFSRYTRQPERAPTLQIVDSYVDHARGHAVARGFIRNGHERAAALNVRLVVSFLNGAGKVIDADQMEMDRIDAGYRTEWAVGVADSASIVRAAVRAEWSWEVPDSVKVASASEHG